MARLDVSTLWIALLLTSSSWAHQPEQHRVARRRDPHGSGMRTQLRHQALEAKRQAQADPEADGLPEVYMTSSTVTPSGTGTPSVVSWWELPYTNPTTTAVKSVWDPAEIAEAMHSIAQDQQLAKDPQPTGDSLWGAQGDSSSSSSSKDWMPSSEDDSCE